MGVGPGLVSRLARCRHALHPAPPRAFSTGEHRLAANAGLPGVPGTATATQQVESKENSVQGDEKLFDVQTEQIGKNSASGKNGGNGLNFEEAREVAIKAREATLKEFGIQKKVWRSNLSEAMEQVLKSSGKKVDSLKVIFGGQPDTPRTSNEEWYYKRVSFWMKRYENVVGLTEVKAAQARVVRSEKRFVETQDLRREAQARIGEIQKKVKDIHMELEKTHRGEDRYLVLVTQEHQVLKEERNLHDEFKLLEKKERECFSALSAAVRDSHEKERAQAEKTKYWGILGSAIGACLGVLGTMINNRMRMNELRKLVSQNSSVEEIRGIGTELSQEFTGHQQSLARLVTEVEGVVGRASESLASLDRLEQVGQELAQSSNMINTRQLDAGMGELIQQQQQLETSLQQNSSSLDTRVEQLTAELGQQGECVARLAQLTQQDREETRRLREEAASQAEKKDLEWKNATNSLNKKNDFLNEILNTNIRSLDDKFKDIRTLLLDQSHVLGSRESFAEKWNKEIERLEKTQISLMQKGFESVNRKLDEAARARSAALAALQRREQAEVESSGSGGGREEELPLLQLDSVTVLLDQHQQRTQRTVLLSALLAATITPVLLYTVSRLLP